LQPAIAVETFRGLSQLRRKERHGPFAPTRTSNAVRGAPDADQVDGIVFDGTFDRSSRAWAIPEVPQQESKRPRSMRQQHATN
jgi:hypothetical protein